MAEQDATLPKCGGCNVREPWEHRCHGRDRCRCPECWCVCGRERPCPTHDAGIFPSDGPPTLIATATLAPYQKAHLTHILNELEQADPVVRRVAARWLACKEDAP